ncbi:MAG: S41 family peptidase [Rhodospirillaceae bacterium]|nr:S41 family peptidase [Rhodospirillaceae bacterium]
MAVVVGLAGCGPVDRFLGHEAAPAHQGDLHLARDMFDTGFEDIDAFYIDDPDLGALALAGLSSLAETDPKIGFRREPGQVVFLYDGAPVRALPIADEAGAEEWGDLTAAAVRAARDSSPSLRAAAEEDIYQTMFSAMMKHLDGFSRYASAKAAAENRAQREGFGGIGIAIAVEDDTVKILSVMHYTPAERAGLKANDVITEVDGRPLKGLKQDAVIALLRGPVGSTVQLGLLRDGQPLTRSLTREHIVPETVAYHREDDIAYFRLSSFNSATADNLTKSLEGAVGELGSRLKGLVLDLRGNPGGLLDQAVDVSDLFLDGGRIVSTHGRHPDSHQYFEARPGDIAHGLPIVVLIDGNSASAAEIVAAALQDRGRAVVVGSNSYGKGSVQTVLRMPNDGELTLTWARFHAPSGYTLNDLGVLPSICTNAGDHDPNKLIAALRAGKLKPVPADLRATISPTDTAGLHRLREECPVRSSEDDDNVDLQLALRLLDDHGLYDRAIRLGSAPGGISTAAMTAPGPRAAPRHRP